MLRRSLWSVGVLAIAAAALLLTPQISEAQRRGGWGGWGGGWGGYRGGWGGNYGYGYPGYWGGYGLGGYRTYGYGYPSYGYSSGYYYPSYGYSSGYYYPSYSAYSYPVYDYNFSPSYTYSPNVSASRVAPAAYQSFYPPNTGYGSSVNPNETRIRVLVPNPNAEVRFNDHRTRQKGYEREFVTEMASGQKGTYRVTARWTENGKMHEETRNVRVRAGQSQVVDFNQSAGTTEGNRAPRQAANPAPRDDSRNRNPGNPVPKEDNPLP
jgi:uncharacterized protein (TIGR03000 family)